MRFGKSGYVKYKKRGVLMIFDFSVLVRKYPVGKYVYIMEDGKKKRFRVSGYSFSNGRWHVDMEGEIRFLLSRLEDLEIKMDSPVMIGEILSGMKKAVCLILQVPGLL